MHLLRVPQSLCTGIVSGDSPAHTRRFSLALSLSHPPPLSLTHTHPLRHTGTHIDRVAWRINPLTIPVSSPPPSLSLAAVPDARRRQSGRIHPTLLQPSRAGDTASGVGRGLRWVVKQQDLLWRSFLSAFLSSTSCHPSKRESPGVRVCVTTRQKRFAPLYLLVFHVSALMLTALRGISAYRYSVRLSPIAPNVRRLL